MQQQRTHDEDTALLRDAGDLRSCSRTGRLVGTNTSQKMRARNNAQGSVVGTAWIEMKPDHYHLFKQFDRRLDEQHTVFFCPVGQGRIFVSFGNWYAKILMHRNQPVPIGGLLKVGALDSGVTGGHQHQALQLRMESPRQRSTPWMLQQLPRTDGIAILCMQLSNGLTFA